jgi:hypothetical protein
MNSIQTHFHRLLAGFHSRDTYTLDQNSFWKNNRMLLLTSLLIFVAVLLWRSWPNFCHPALYKEDATHYFSFFYGGKKGISALLHNPNYYHVILTNFIASLVAKIDVRWQPTFYLWIATTLAIVAVMTIPCSGLLKNKYLIFIAPFLLGLSGLNHLYYYTTLAYQIFTLVLIFIGALFWQPLQGNTKNILLFILLSLLIWSGPYSVLVVPFSLCFILLFRGKTRLLLLLSVVAILYTLAVRAHTITLHRIFDPVILKIWFNALITKVFLMGLRSARFNPEKIWLVAAFFLGIFAILRKDRFYLKIAFILLVLINGCLAELFLSKKYLSAMIIRPCYLVTAQFLWLTFLLFTTDRILAKSKKLYHGGLLVCVLVVSFIYYDNLRIPAKRSVPLMTTLPAYLDKIYAAEQQILKDKNRGMIIQFSHMDSHGYMPLVTIGEVNDPAIPVEFIQMQ